MAVRIFWYSTTKLVIGHPPSFQAAKSKIIELEFTFIKWIVDSGAIGAEPLVWSDTVSVLSPTPKSFKAYIHVKSFIISMYSAAKKENNHVYIVIICILTHKIPTWI